MFLFYFTDRTSAALTIFVVCIMYSVNGNTEISENYRYRKLECKVDVDGLESVPARSFVQCSTLCSEDANCSIAHFQRTGSCMIDTRPNHTIPADATPGDNYWISHLKYQHDYGSIWTKIGSSSYHVSADFYTWPDCQTYCLSHSSTLAAIRNIETMTFAVDNIYMLPLDDKYLHIGGEKNPDLTWRWTNGKPWDFTSWDSIEPSNNNGELCLSVFHRFAMLSWNRYGWDDIECLLLGYCLCEKSPLTDFKDLPYSCLPDE